VKKNLLSRRALLAALGATAGLPLLDSLLPGLKLGGAAHAQTAPAPKRLVIFWHPNGIVPDAWACSGTETNFHLSRILKPLEPHKQDILVLDGVDALSAYEGPGDAHQKATGQCLTGTELQEGSFQGDGGLSSGWANNISIDQVVANEIGKHSRFQSLELGVYVFGANVGSRISYRGPAEPLPPENDPRAAFERLFSDPAEDPAVRAHRIARRKSVLDSVSKRYDKLMPRLGSTDRQKLQQHLTALREIEQRLDATDGSQCAAPGPAPTVKPNVIANIPQIGRAQMDIMVQALACDLTRVGSIMWTNSASDKTFPWLGIHEGHHELAHRGDSDAHAKEALTKIYTWYAEQLEYLIAKMKTVKEGNGTLLDNTLILWATEHSKGNVHDRHGMPFVLAGRAGGAVRPGRLLKFSGDVPHNNLLVSCLNAMGVPATTFGNPAYCTGPLPGLS
jgi:hypothetical protein